MQAAQEVLESFLYKYSEEEQAFLSGQRNTPPELFTDQHFKADNSKDNAAIGKQFAAFAGWKRMGSFVPKIGGNNYDNGSSSSISSSMGLDSIATTEEEQGLLLDLFERKRERERELQVRKKIT